MFVKFCGFTRPEDVDAACSLGVSACGFIFYAGSQRFCNFYTARECIAICKQHGVKSVGVFVDNNPTSIASIAYTLGLDALQVYSEDAYVELSPHFTILFGMRVGKNFSMHNIPVIDTKDFYLFDTFDSSQYGGTGKQFDWNIVASFPHINRSIISGGLRSSNVALLCTTVKPFGVDVASGIEDAPGIKNVFKMKEFIQAIKECGYDISR
ncbi:MAG: phosphoribosylanthranilate isomerase [Spirochaetes bacterium]|nr:phosphoribosylanthranilate isomerase [Spirochaetota bacterium]